MTNTDPGAPEYEFDWQNPSKKSFEVGRVLGRAFSGAFANIKPLLVAIAITVIFTIAMSILSTSQVKNIIGTGDFEAALTSSGYWLWSFGSAIPTLFFTLWIQLIVVETSYADFTNSPQPNSPLTSSLRFILPMLVVAIIYTIVCIAGFYAILIGFLFAWPGWALAGPVLVHEKKGIFGSLGQAWNLSKGFKRWIFLILFLLGILAFVGYAVLSGLTIAIIGVNDIFSGDPMAALSMSISQQILVSLLSGFGSYFIYAIFASGVTAAYVEVKTIKDGTPNLSEIFN